MRLPDDQTSSLAFCEQRPEGERWELLDGVPYLTMTPASYRHEKIIANLAALLLADGVLQGKFDVLFGAGVQVPELGDTAVIPDIAVRPSRPYEGGYCNDPIVVFEILSPHTESRDLGFKAGYYPDVPTIEQIVIIISQNKTLVDSHARANGFRREAIENWNAAVPLPALGAELPLAAIYRNTGLGPVS